MMQSVNSRSWGICDLFHDLRHFFRLSRETIIKRWSVPYSYWSLGGVLIYLPRPWTRRW